MNSKLKAIVRNTVVTSKRIVIKYSKKVVKYCRFLYV